MSTNYGYPPASGLAAGSIQSQWNRTVGAQALDPLGLDSSLPLIPIINPQGLRWADHGIPLRRQGLGNIFTDFLVSSQRPTPAVTYYFDPRNITKVASNANAGTDPALPLLTKAAAIAKADADVVLAILDRDYFARTSESYNNVNATRSIHLGVYGTGNYVSIQCGSSVLPIWVKTAGYSNVYETTITSNNCQAITDLFARTPHPQLDPRFATERHKAILEAARRPFRQLIKVGSIPLVAQQAGSWYHDGTKAYVQAHDLRDLSLADQYMQPTANGNNGRAGGTGNITISVQGWDFVGGRPFYATATEAAAITGVKLIFDDVIFQGSGFSNGISIELFAKVYMHKCGAYWNWADGFNGHCPTAPTAAGVGISPQVFTNECVAYGNGQTGSSNSSDNALTFHEDSQYLSVNDVFPNSDDRTVAHIDTTDGWILGSYIGAAMKKASGKENLAVLNSAVCRVDSCIVVPDGNPTALAANTAVLKVYNSGPLVNAGTTEATGTVATFLA